MLLLEQQLFWVIKYIIVPDKRQAPVNDTTFTTAQGAFAVTEIVKKLLICLE